MMMFSEKKHLKKPISIRIENGLVAMLLMDGVNNRFLFYGVAHKFDWPYFITIMTSIPDKANATNTQVPDRITLIDCLNLDAERRQLFSQTKNYTSAEKHSTTDKAENRQRRVTIDRLRQALHKVQKFMDEFPFEGDA